ncbi:MAG: citrate (Si)-synthase [candidate division KSB1 bacterium]|nr:citrate (Si)-synthase [candidate division KSB1 bacterium]
MATIREKLAEKVPQWREEIGKLVKEHGNDVIGEVTVQQIYGGMRGVRCLVCDTSYVDPEKGLIIRGYPISTLTDRLPEEIIWLLLTGDLPTPEERDQFIQELAARRNVPEGVWRTLEAMPEDSHPMTMLSVAALVMEKDSVFKKKYDEGVRKEDYWIWTLEDALDLMARMPVVAAGIYRLRYKKGPRIPSDPKLDMGADYARMLGLPNPNGELEKLMRLYLVLHCDHESGNVSAFTTHTVASALSNIYYAYSAGMNGLAGPLHGLANQETLKWIQKLRERFGGVPTHEQLRDFTWETLNSGQVIPGYGHAVLRQTDPRFTAFLEFGKKYCADDEIFQIVVRLFEVVPDILKQTGKVKDPYPNVDAGSGALLWHYGMTEYDYYTVIFGISRAFGVCAQTVVSRAILEPITRPKSVTTEWIKQQVGAA